MVLLKGVKMFEFVSRVPSADPNTLRDSINRVPSSCRARHGQRKNRKRSTEQPKIIKTHFRAAS